MERTEINVVIEKIDDSINKSMDEKDNLITIVFPTLVILLLLKKILKYNQNEKQNENESNTELKPLIKNTEYKKIFEPCKVCEAMYAAAASSSEIKNMSTLFDINKYCSNNHCHIHTFYTLYNNYGIDGVKKFLNYSIIHLNPLTYTITNKKELDYYKGRLIQEENQNASLNKQLVFWKAKSSKLCEQLQNEKNSHEIKEKCLKETNRRLEKTLSEYMSKCDELEEVNESLKHQIELKNQKKEKSTAVVSYNASKSNINSMTEDDLFQFNAFDFGFSSPKDVIVSDAADKEQEFINSEEEEDNLMFSNDYSNNNDTISNSIVFKRQEEQRRNEEEANQLLSDLDLRGIDDFVLKIQKGEYKFKDVAASLLKQLIISDLDVVQVSIELDQFVKRCGANKYDVLKSMVEFICKLIENNKQNKITICAFEVIRKYMDLFQEYVGTDKKDKIQFLTLLFNYCKSINTIKPVFINILEKLHNLNLVEASTILNWYNLQNREDLKCIMDKSETLEIFLENLKYESFKRNIMLKKEFDSHDDMNDSGFCSDEDEMNEWLSNEEQIQGFNLENISLDGSNSESLDSSSTTCHCCNCNHDISYDTSLLKDKNISHVRFIFDSETEFLSDPLLLKDTDNENNDVLKDNSHSCLSDNIEDDRCLLDIVEDIDEEENLSFIIQDIKGESIFSNKNILDDDCCCSNSIGDNSSESSIVMDSIDSQVFPLEESKNTNCNCSLDGEEKTECNSSNYDNNVNNQVNELSLSIVEQESFSQEEEIEEEIYIVNKNYCTVDDMYDEENDSSEENDEKVMYENEEVNDIDVEICFETNIEKDGNEEIVDDDSEEEEEEEESDEENEDFEICFERENEDNYDDDEEEDDEDEDDEDEDDEDDDDDEEDDEEEEEEEDSDIEDSDLEICFENDTKEKDNASTIQSSDEYSEEEEEYENNQDEEFEEEIITLKRSNSDNEICEYISEHEKSNQYKCSKRVFQLNSDSESSSESECESDSEDEIEIAFEVPSDAETEIYSNESEEEDITYDTESDDGSDTEFDDDKIERIASLRSILPSDDYTIVDKSSHVHRVSSSKPQNNSITINEDKKEKEDNENHESKGINSDLDEIIYDSDIDIVFCSSDCTIEISDDQGEANYYKSIGDSGVPEGENHQISSLVCCGNQDYNIKNDNEEEENNANLYPNLEKMKEDGQKKYINNNLKKRNLSIEKDIKKLLKCYLSNPEIKYEIEEVISKYNLNSYDIPSTYSSKLANPKFLEKVKKNKKKIAKKSKKHSIRNENYLNKSSLRDFN